MEFGWKVLNKKNGEETGEGASTGVRSSEMDSNEEEKARKTGFKEEDRFPQRENVRLCLIARLGFNFGHVELRQWKRKMKRRVERWLGSAYAFEHKSSIVRKEKLWPPSASFGREQKKGSGKGVAGFPTPRVCKRGRLRAGKVERGRRKRKMEAAALSSNEEELSRGSVGGVRL